MWTAHWPECFGSGRRFAGRDSWQRGNKIHIHPRCPKGTFCYGLQVFAHSESSNCSHNEKWNKFSNSVNRRRWKWCSYDPRVTCWHRYLRKGRETSGVVVWFLDHRVQTPEEPAVLARAARLEPHQCAGAVHHPPRDASDRGAAVLQPRLLQCTHLNLQRIPHDRLLHLVHHLTHLRNHPRWRRAK